MNRRIEELAYLSVARACGFAGLATFCMMIGFADQLIRALLCGGLCALTSSLIILLRMQMVKDAQFKTTEVWIMLSPAERPPVAYAAHIIMRARRRAMLDWAFKCAAVAAVMLAASFIGALFSGSASG